MYGYGYRYPRVPRKVEVLYEDPKYRAKWVRAAIGNRAVAAQSPWIKHLRQSGVFETIKNLLRQEAVKYRQSQGVKESTRKGAERRIVKLQRAIDALKDQAIIQNVASQLGNKYNPAYVEATIKRLEEEINNLNAMLNFKPAPQPQPQQPVAKGYGLLSGLGYGYGEDEGYGYFY
jgi:hypothetical protein